MAKPPAGKKPAPPKKPVAQKAAPKPVAPKKVAGKAAPSRNVPVAKKAPPPRRKPAKPPALPTEQHATQDAPAATSTALTDKQQRFVDEYMVDLNATQAAIRAGYSPDTAYSIGHENLKKPEIQAAIAAARRAQQERTAITADMVLQEIANVALADARDLVEVKTGCCRCCYGEGHKWQRTVGEMNRDREAWVEKGKNPAEFDEAGGIGFNPLLLPKDDCPICGGDGMARTVLKDTRHLGPRAVALYAGAKQTKEGIEVKMHSKLDALEKLAKHLGLYGEDNKQKADALALLLGRVSAGNGNGFSPVQDDPERKPSAMPVRQGDSDEDDGA